MSYSPGPWILNRTPTYWGVKQQVTGRLLATVPHSKHAGSDELAQLIAAAPELLGALKLAVRQNQHDMMLTGEELRVCEQAIAKAEGRS